MKSNLLCAKLLLLAALPVLGMLTPRQAIAISAPELQARLLSDIAFQYAKLGVSQQAVAISEQALEATAAMQPCFKANSLARVAGSYWLIGQEAEGQRRVTEAIETAEAQAATGCSNSTSSPTESLMYRAREFADEGQFELAIALADGMGDPLALSEIAADLLDVGQSQRADELLKEAIAQAQTIDDVYYRTQTLNVMGMNLALAGQTEPAKAVLEQAILSAATLETDNPERDSLQGSALLWTARQFTELGANDRAIALLDQTVPKIRNRSTEPFPLDKVIQLVDAALLYQQVGLNDKTVAILAEAHQVGRAVAPDNALRGRADADALGRVAVGYAKIGDFERAMQIVEEIQPVSERQGALGDIAIAYAAAGNLEAAVELAESNPNRNGAMIGIVRHYLQEKQPDQAWQVVQAHQVKGILSEVAVGYLDIEQPEQALQLVQTGNLEGFTPDIVQGYAASGQPEQAMLAQSEGIEWLLPSVVQGFAQQEQFDAALQTAQSIADPVDRAQALLAIAHAYTEPQTEAQGIRRFVTRTQDRIVGLFGTSDRERAAEVLVQALQATQSTSSAE